MRTDYQNYIPSTANRKYNLINNEDGTVSLVDVTVYQQEGDKLSAGVLNELSQNANWPLTHAKTGTTHALTGLTGVTGIVSCVFTATGDFVAGDSFTVDGVGYAVQLTDGSTAHDNLFVSGAEVPVVADTTNHKLHFTVHRQVTWQTITLTQGGWNSGTKQQTVAVPGITVSGDGLVKPFPVAGESQTLWSENSVKALPLQADGQLIFACESVPEGNISVIVEVVK